MRYSAEDLLVRPIDSSEDPELILHVSPEMARWEFISFQVRRLDQGNCWSFETGDNELAIVNLTGLYQVESNRGQWSDIGGRESVFEDAAHALYLPRHTEFTVTAEKAGDFAVAWVPATQDHDPWLIRPDQVSRGVRGGDNASRQINDLSAAGVPRGKAGPGRSLYA